MAPCCSDIDLFKAFLKRPEDTEHCSCFCTSPSMFSFCCQSSVPSFLTPQIDLGQTRLALVQDPKSLPQVLASWNRFPIPLAFPLALVQLAWDFNNCNFKTNQQNHFFQNGIQTHNNKHVQKCSLGPWPSTRGRSILQLGNWVLALLFFSLSWLFLRPRRLEKRAILADWEISKKGLLFPSSSSSAVVGKARAWFVPP